ncbi:MAG: hypothetical protein H6560_07405 [Lewinellaceae bacterium]|nr:hypothetical protein [Lewinellaceae bacterium]
MPPIDIMRVDFDADISPAEVPAFRGAVIEKVGIEQEIFHNHNNEAGGNGYHYRYPLIQYKALEGRPAILFIGDAVSEAHHLFRQPDWELSFTRRKLRGRLVRSQTKEYEVGLTPAPRPYLLRRWLALNQDNHRRFEETRGMAARARLLERVLAGHILGFASGVGIRFEERFELAITEIEQQRIRSFEGVKSLTFDVRFEANLLLPPHIGLGKGVTQGFGVLG